MYSHLVQWKSFGKWFFRHSFSSIPIAAGSIGMGCIGYPPHPVWEVTSRCNLKCLHCHIGDVGNSDEELTTEEAKEFIDELRKVNEFRMLVYTGGEPLVRPDIFELLEYSYSRGFINVIATNGTLINDPLANKLRNSGVAAAAVSLDSSLPEVHNQIRADESAFEAALRGIRAIKNAGIPLQINVTAMKYNFSQLGELIDMADGNNAAIVLIYQLVPVGRGNMIESLALDTAHNEKLLKFIAEKQRFVASIIEPVAGPQYWPVILTRRAHKSKFWNGISKIFFHGCCAGRGFVYIKANGDVWPCPFIEKSAGNIRQELFTDIWNNAEIFLRLRNRENLLKGKCGCCDYKSICGGCRARALAHSGEIMSEDPTCFIGK